nr:hypothetical protein [Sphingobium herbicidovorans]
MYDTLGNAIAGDDPIRLEIFNDPDAPVARSLGESIRDIDRVHLPIARHEIGAPQIVGENIRETLGDFCWRKILRLKTGIFRARNASTHIFVTHLR